MLSSLKKKIALVFPSLALLLGGCTYGNVSNCRNHNLFFNAGNHLLYPDNQIKKANSSDGETDYESQIEVLKQQIETLQKKLDALNDALSHSRSNLFSDVDTMIVKTMSGHEQTISNSVLPIQWLTPFSLKISSLFLDNYQDGIYSVTLQSTSASIFISSGTKISSYLPYTMNIYPLFGNSTLLSYSLSNNKNVYEFNFDDTLTGIYQIEIIFNLEDGQPDGVHDWYFKLESAELERAFADGYQTGVNGLQSDLDSLKSERDEYLKLIHSLQSTLDTYNGMSYDEILTLGYNKGKNSVTNESTAFLSLFTGLSAVPFNILNGLSSLTIWQTSIISIIVTLTMLAVVIWIVRKII